MFEWLLKLIGVEEDFRTHLEHVTLALQRPLVFWVGLALLVPVGYFIYRRQKSNLTSAPRALRIALSSTRIVILAVLLFVLAGPFLKLDEKIERKPILSLLFDQSQSMALPAGPFEDDAQALQMAEAAGYQVVDGKVDAETRKLLNRVGRAKLAQDVVLAKGDAFWKPLREKYELRCYSLTGDLARITLGPDKLILPESQANGPSTHLGDALAQLLDEAAGRQMAGIVLFSDGQNTGGTSPVEAARAASQAGAPVIVVPAGNEGPIKDIAVVDLFAPDLVTVQDKVKVSVTLELQGYPEQAVKVVLLEDNAQEPLDSKDLILKNTEQQHVDLTFEAKTAGSHTLTVAVRPAIELPDDLKENNSDSVIVRVSEEKLKVLYLEGLPRWDFRYLKNAMRRDHGLGGRAGDEPDLVLEAEYRRRSSEEQALLLPQTLDELSQYHTVILGDVSPALLRPELIALLDEAVRKKGVGLLVASGPLSMPHQYDDALTDLLPVKMRPKAAGMEAPVYKPFKLEVSPDGAIHDSMRLYDDPGRNDSVWSQMPPYFWCAAAERPSLAASVLAYNPSVEGRYGKLPLIAHHYAGQGKVMFVGTDSTWLWRQNVGDRFYYRFWGQSIRFVARRDEDALKKKSWVEVRPVRARPGEAAAIELMAIAKDGTPRKADKLSVKILADGLAPKTVELSADHVTAGRFTGKFTPQATGNYRIQYEPAPGEEPVEARMHVASATEELRQPNVNLETLTQMGKVVRLNELATLPDLLQGETDQRELHREASVWDNWLTLVFLVLIYSLDVGLRRLAGLS